MSRVVPSHKLYMKELNVFDQYMSRAINNWSIDLQDVSHIHLKSIRRHVWCTMFIHLELSIHKRLLHIYFLWVH